MRLRIFAAVAAALMAGPAVADPAGIPAAIATIKAVGREGAGNDAAGPAWKQLVAHGGPALMPTLAGFDGASPAAANWLRAAVDAVIEGEKTAGRPLPTADLEAFATDTRRAPAARRIAFELLIAQDPAKKAALLPAMVDDPSLALRRDAIADAMDRAAKLDDKAAQAKEYGRLFAAARDRDEVEALAKLLGERGVKADVTAHYGFVTRWHIAGPFDGPAGSGFDKPYPPEEKVDLSATYPGKGGAKIAWKAVNTARPAEHFALVNLNADVGKTKDAVTYAYAVIESDKETPVELRAACPTAIKIFLNGKPVFAREEYHHGNSLDQHAGAGILKPGRNEVLVKVCQNNQQEEWAQVWEFELRVCDATGGAVPFRLVSPTADQVPPPPKDQPAKKEEK